MNLTELHQLFLKHPSISTDTRKITKNCLFFALKGRNFNGNRFASEAIEKGAEFAIIDEAEFAVSEKYILVDDVLESLQKLSTFHRNYSKAQIIGITGSNGKTTTKELIYSVISKKHNTIATKGNLNNHIGVPLTLLSIKEDTEFAIVEMGANHQGEIAFLSSLAQPDFGYITNFGKAHLEGFGGVEGVIKGKSELYQFLFKNGKYAFLNADDPIQKDKLANYIKKIGFSKSDDQFYIIELIETNPFLKIKVEDNTINTSLIGKYNFPNCCAAIVMGKYFGVAIENIVEAIESYVPQNNRSQIIQKNGCTIVLDAYNANPSSMSAALENFAQMDRVHKIAILGDMFELGDTAKQEHQRIADYSKALHIDMVFLVGEHFKEIQSDFDQFESYEKLTVYLEANKLPKSSILIKASRGMALERILELL